MRIKALVVLFVLFFLLVNPFYAGAKTLMQDSQSDDAPVVEITDSRVKFSFQDLNYSKRDLISPVDSKSYIFSAPPNWKFAPGGEIELHYDVFLSGADLNRITGDGSPYGGNMILQLNGVLIDTIPFNETGNYKVRLQLPPESLVPSLEGGRHLLTISLNAQLSCTYDIYALVTIRPTSFFDLPFEVSSPDLDLSHLPAPFFLENSFIPDGVLVVVPDEPEALELQAAINVMAGLGSMIDDNYNVELVNVGRMTKPDLAKYHMIFVGKPSGLGILSEANFQVPISDGRFVGLPEKSVGDGILQLALSPWNPNKALMLVSGNSGEAVLKAGQAVSTGRIFVYENLSLAYVSNIQLLSGNVPTMEDFSLKSLGYMTSTFSSIGESSDEYQFYVSKEQVLTKDGYIDLVYYHSGLSDQGNSSFSLSLNDQVISSIGFQEETQQVTTLQVKIPPGVLRFGENRLKISAELLMTPSCDETGFRVPWLTVSDQTNFHLPSASVSGLAQSLLKDLKFFPDLFTTHSDLGDTVFVLPKSEPTSWRLAGKLAYTLGKTVTPAISNLEVAYADDVPQNIRNDYSMIVIGKVAGVAFLPEINDRLPAPFDFETGTASERQMQVVYRIPPGVNVGYLELIASPFNNENTILVVAGNTDAGLEHAGNILLNDSQSQLAGVFAVTNGIQVATGKIAGQFSIVGTGVPGSELVVTTPIPGVQIAKTVPPGWLMPVIGLSGIAVVVIVAFVVKSIIDKKRLYSIRDLKLKNDAESDESTQHTQ